MIIAALAIVLWFIFCFLAWEIYDLVRDAWTGSQAEANWKARSK